jgi:DNA repair protein RadD
VLTVVFDFPKLDCIILARPTMSLALYYQMLGRGVRTAEGKEFCVVYDACNNSTKFGKVESYIIEDTGNAKYRLKSDNKYLTGYNFVTDKDVEAYRNVRKEQSTKQKQEIKSGEHVIGFGKFKDSKLKDLPDSYLEWCIKNFDNGIWKETFLNEINRRRVLL